MTRFTITRPPCVSRLVPTRHSNDIGSAIDSLYGDDYRDWTINFCDIPINLCMNCIADVYADMVRIEADLRLGKKSRESFLSPQITCLFDIEPGEKHVLIHSWWTSASDDQFLQKLQDLPQPSRFDRNEFHSEIIKFLQSIKLDLIKVGYNRLYNKNHPWGIKQY